jgi:hypothetical protein
MPSRLAIGAARQARPGRPRLAAVSADLGGPATCAQALAGQSSRGFRASARVTLMAAAGTPRHHLGNALRAVSICIT